MRRSAGSPREPSQNLAAVRIAHEPITLDAASQAYWLESGVSPRKMIATSDTISAMMVDKIIEPINCVILSRGVPG